MNSWSQEHYAMHMGMAGMNTAMNNVPPLLPPMCIMPEMNHPPLNPPQPIPVPLIGPVQPENIINQETPQQQQLSQQFEVSGVHDETKQFYDRRDRDKVRDSDNRRHRSRSRENRDRFDRNGRRDRSDRSSHSDRNDSKGKRDRERKSKWDQNTNSMNQQSTPMGINNMLMPGMMPYPNMVNNVMVPQQMDGSQLQGMIPTMNMMGGIMPNMIDQNIMMMNQQMMMNHQAIFITNGILLPPLPGLTTPPRREKPKGCRTIFIGGLPKIVTTDTIAEIFQRFGPIEDVKYPRHGVFYVRYEKAESVEQSFLLSGYRIKYHDQNENEATTIFIDYAVNRDDKNEYDKSQGKREPTPPRVEAFTQTALNNIGEQIKSEENFATAAPTLASWLERGECNKKNANIFYSLIQASNNQIRRLFNEKMQLDEEYQTLKTQLKEKFSLVLNQFEQVAKILSAAKHQRVSDHFTKQQRRNVEMWLKMTEELDNIREEYNATFDDEEIERVGKNMVPFEKYEEMRIENENLTYELEGYKNEAHLAKGEAERKFEKFKAHFIAEQALKNKQTYPPLPPPPRTADVIHKPMPPPPTPDDNKIITTGPAVPPSEAKLISILTAFLMVHPLGASLDYLVSYVRSMSPNVTQGTVLNVLQKYSDVFVCQTRGVGATIEHRWTYVTFEVIKTEAL